MCSTLLFTTTQLLGKPHCRWYPGAGPNGPGDPLGIPVPSKLPGTSRSQSSGPLTDIAGHPPTPQPQWIWWLTIGFLIFSHSEIIHCWLFHLIFFWPTNPNVHPNVAVNVSPGVLRFAASPCILCEGLPWSGQLLQSVVLLWLLVGVHFNAKTKPTRRTVAVGGKKLTPYPPQSFPSHQEGEVISWIAFSNYADSLGLGSGRLRHKWWQK